MRLTPGEIALIAPTLTFVMAIATLWITDRNTKRTLAHQREMAHDERVWNERSALYVDLIDFSRRWQSRAIMNVIDPSTPMVPLLTDEEIRGNERLQARAGAFASREVQERRETLSNAIIALGEWNIEQQDANTPEERELHFRNYRPRLRSVTDASAALIDQIRSELGLDSPND